MSIQYGKEVLGMLSEEQTLPGDGTPVASSAMCYIAGPALGKLWIDVYAATDIEIASGNLLYIEIRGFTSDDTSSATVPYTINNQGGIFGASGTLETDAHYYLLCKTSATTALNFSSGDLITQGAIPEDMFRLLSYDYVELLYTVDTSEAAEKVTAFVYSKI